MTNSFVMEYPDSKDLGAVIGFDKDAKIDDYNLLTTGAGGIYSTAHDLFLLDQALYSGKLISAELYKEAILPQQLNNGKKFKDKYGWSYGYGWEVRKDSLHNVVRHTGGFNGFSTVYYRELFNHRTIIILTNKGQNTWQRGPTMVALLNILENKQFKYPLTI